MSILARYIAKDFFWYWVACLVSVLLLIIVAALLGDIDEAFKSWQKFVRFWHETVKSLPNIVEILLPVTVLLATMFTFAGYSRSSELVAMKTAGMGRTRLMLPLVAVVVMVSALAYVNQNYLYRWLNDTEEARALKEQHQWRSLNNAIVYLGRIDSAANRVTNATLFSWQDSPFHFTEVNSLPGGGRSAEQRWDFQDVMAREKQADSWKVTRVPVKEYQGAEFPDVFRPLELDAHHLPLLDLYQEIRQRESQASPQVEVYTLEWYRKLGILTAPAVMVLIGTPLSLFHFRRGRASAEVMVILVVGLVFMIGSEIFFILGKGGFLPALLSATGMNGVFALLGLGLLSFSR